MLELAASTISKNKEKNKLMKSAVVDPDLKPASIDKMKNTIDFFKK